MSALPSVQRFHVRLGGIADDTLYLADGRPRAIFAVEPGDLRLADDARREVATQRRAAFLDASHSHSSSCTAWCRPTWNRMRRPSTSSPPPAAAAWGPAPGWA
jgi:hypothetical protein